MGSYRRRILWEQQKGLCWYCKKPVPSREATEDHILAKSKGGSSKVANLVMACLPCNKKKAARRTHRQKTPGRVAALVALVKE